jgi:hypothetical protein
MIVTEDHSETELYVESALNLHSSIIRNTFDSQFSDRKGEIVYIFDANIFVFYADVNDDRRLTEDIDNLVGVGAEQVDIARAMERLTAEFLFSGRLPAQRRERAFISLPHFQESLDVASAIDRKLKRATNESGLSSEQIDQVRSTVTNIIESSDPLEQKFGQLAEILPKAWFAALDGYAHFKRVVKEAYIDPGSLVPLDKSPWQANIEDISHEEVQPWYNALPPPSDRRPLEKIRADGQTLAMLTRLYQRDPESRGPRRRRIYVLVTTDSGVVSAVRRRMPILQRDGIPFFIRSPRDYLPLLNLNAMSMALSRGKPNLRLQRAFQRVFDALAAATDWIALLNRPERLDTSVIVSDAPLEELRKAWVEISEYVTVLTARHINDVTSLFSDLNEFLNDNAQQEVAKLVESSVNSVRDKHLAIVIDSVLAGMRPVDSRPTGYVRRKIHIQVLDDIFAPLIPGGDLDSYLDAVIKKGALSEDVSATLIEQADRVDVQLLAASIFIAADRWALATQAASRALDQLEAASRTTQSTFAARYLLAHCLCFSMRTPGDFERAKRLLATNLKAYERGESGGITWRRRIRDTLELGSLLTTAAIMQELSRTPSGDKYLGRDTKFELLVEESASDCLIEGMRRLSTTLEEVRDAESAERQGSPAQDLRASQFFHGAKLLGATNLIEAYVYARIVPGLKPASSFADFNLEDTLGTLEEEIETREAAGEVPRPVHGIVLWRCRALLTDDAELRARFLSKMQDQIAVARSIRDLPTLDLIEFDFIDEQCAPVVQL